MIKVIWRLRALKQPLLLRAGICMEGHGKMRDIQLLKSIAGMKAKIAIYMFTNI